MTEADRHTEVLRFRMTPAELVQAQLWIWKLEKARRHPQGTRRRNDHERAPLKVWRLRKGWSLTDLAGALRWVRGGGLFNLETLRALEDGTAPRSQYEKYRVRIAAVLEIPPDRLVLGPGPQLT